MPPVPWPPAFIWHSRSSLAQFGGKAETSPEGTAQ